MNRALPAASPILGFTALEIHLLDELMKDKRARPSRKDSLSNYLIKLARLDGYLAREVMLRPGIE